MKQKKDKSSKSNNREKGKKAEDITCLYLVKNGYKIIARNYNTPYGEIDIIAENLNYIVFIEVKYRKNIDYGYPSEAVDKNKQRHIKNSALYFIQNNNTENYDFRFDVSEIIDNEIEYIENAFY